MPRITAVIASENALLRDALTALLHAQPGIRLLGQATGEHEALRKAVALHPQVILLEPWSVPGATVRTVRSLRRLAPETAVLALPGGSTRTDHHALRAAGVHGYLPRHAGSEALLAALGALFPAAVQGAGRVPYAALSRREREVLSGAAAAMTNQQIARGLGITTGTVKRHLHTTFRKLDAVSRLDAVAKALAAGLISAPGPARPLEPDGPSDPAAPPEPSGGAAGRQWAARAA
ncbi:response regulator transcription factor [Streptomyces sp. NPDC053542]|uniref:response regulator transcription factor n=1 Tax=Streptomyces sp. NPDC053542 TaxID=3365710 RepID=UPI0037D5892A